MKKLFIMITIFALTAFGATHISNVESHKNEPKIEVVQYVSGWAANCYGEDYNGYSYYGSSFGYSTRTGAINRARRECSKAGGIYNQRWESWHNY